MLAFVHPFLALALLLAAGVGVIHLLRRSAHRGLPEVPTLRSPMAAGAAFVLLGVLLGPGLRVLDSATLRDLTPLTALGLGAIGALAGTALPWRLLRRMPRREWAAGAALAAATFILTALVTVALVRLVPALAAAWRPVLPAVVTFGAISAVGTSIVPGATRRVTAIATLLGIGAFAVMLAAYRPGAGTLAAGWGIPRIAGMVASGVGVGLLAIWLARLRDGAADRAALRLELFATVLAGAGWGLATRLSPFIICLIAGALIAGRASGSVGRARRHLRHDGLPLLAVVLTICGAMLRVPTWWLVPAALVLGGVRIAAWWVVARYGRRWTSIGRLAVAAGPAVALALSHELAFRPVIAERGAILATALGGVLLAQAVSAALGGAGFPAPIARPLTAAAPRAEVT